jgi:hypothetical protein
VCCGFQTGQSSDEDFICVNAGSENVVVFTEGTIALLNVANVFGSFREDDCLRYVNPSVGQGTEASQKRSLKCE